MTFEVVKDNLTVFFTEHKECIYNKSTLKTMSQNGYTFKIDGKRASLQRVLDIIS